MDSDIFPCGFALNLSYGQPTKYPEDLLNKYKMLLQYADGINR